MYLVEPLMGATALYVIVSPTARTTPDWPPRGYAGPSGRLDVVARAIAAALTAEPSAAAAAVLLGPPTPPRILLATPRSTPWGASERWVMESFRLLFRGRKADGMLLAEGGLGELLYAAAKASFSVYILEEGGTDISRVPEALECRAAFVAGAHVDIPDRERAIATRYSRGVLSIGPRSLLTSHVFAFLGSARSLRGLVE